MRQTEFAYERLPLEIRATIDGMAQTARGRPWFIAAKLAHSLLEGMSEAWGPNDESFERARQDVLMAYLERLGARPRPVTDPFQALIYAECSRKDFRRAGNQFIRKAGGRAAVEKLCEAWCDAHGDELGPQPVSMPGWRLGEVDPRSEESAVPDLMALAEEHAKNAMKAEGEVVPSVLFFETRGGRQMALALKPGPADRYEDLIPMLREMLRAQDAHAGALAFEAWAASPEENIRPAQSENRQEMVLVYGLAEKICTGRAFYIRRDEAGVTLESEEGWDVVRCQWAAMFDDAVWEECFAEFGKLNLTPEDAMEITAEVTAAIDWITDNIIAGIDPESVDAEAVVAALTPKSPATLRLAGWIARNVPDHEMREIQSLDGRTISPALLAGTVRSFATVLDDQGYAREVQLIREALNRGDSAAVGH